MFRIRKYLHVFIVKPIEGNEGCSTTENSKHLFHSSLLITALLPGSMRTPLQYIIKQTFSVTATYINEETFEIFKAILNASSPELIRLYLLP